MTDVPTFILMYDGFLITSFRVVLVHEDVILVCDVFNVTFVTYITLCKCELGTMPVTCLHFCNC